MVARHRCRLRRCTCQLFRNSPPSAPIHPWHFPDHPWSRIHIDFVGPFLGKMFFVIIDAHSKWMEIHTMASGTNASATIEKLRQTFAIFGLPQELVSDNAPGFASQSFQMFMFENGIKHIKAALCHPASNGLADRAVQTFKIRMKKLSGPLETKLSRFLFAYHTTPQTSTGLAPAQLMFSRRLCTRLDLLFPHSSVVDSVQKSQERMIVSRQGRNSMFLKRKIPFIASKAFMVSCQGRIKDRSTVISGSNARCTYHQKTC